MQDGWHSHEYKVGDVVEFNGKRHRIIGGSVRTIFIATNILFGTVRLEPRVIA